MKKATMIAIASLLTVASLGCAYGQAACKVVDAARTACVVLRYMDESGKERSVRVTREELATFGERIQHSRIEAAK